MKKQEHSFLRTIIMKCTQSCMLRATVAMSNLHRKAATHNLHRYIRLSFFLLAGQLFFSAASAQRSHTSYKDSTVVRFFQRTQGWAAGDGAFSIPLSNGSVLWTMGDSFIDTYDPATQKVPAFLIRTMRCCCSRRATGTGGIQKPSTAGIRLPKPFLLILQTTAIGTGQYQAYNSPIRYIYTIVESPALMGDSDLP